MSQLLSLNSVLSSALYIGLAILVLLLMVTIHELGHYLAGKMLKFKINEFAIGFGKVLYSRVNKSGEKFSIRLFPLGGFCAFEGEDQDGKSNPRAFNNQKVWKRLVVLFMGPFFNILSAVLFSFIFLMAYGYADRVQVVNVEENFRTQAGVVQETDWLMTGDVIIAVNGEKTNFVYDKYFKNMIVEHDAGEDYTVTVLREGKEVVLTLQNSYVAVPNKMDGNVRLYALNNTDYLFKIYLKGDGKLVLENIKNSEQNYVSDATGLFKISNEAQLKAEFNITTGIYDLSILRIGIETQFYQYSFVEALGQAWVFAFGWAWKVLVILWMLVSGGMGLDAIGGPITTITTIADATQMNFANFFLLLPLIAVNLGVFNLLPFPALDGARMVFVALEGIFRRPVVSRNTEGYIHFIGLVVLMLFVIVVDLIHFLS